YVLDQELRRSEADPAIVRRLIWATYKHVEFLSDPEYLASGNHAIFMMTGLGWLLKALPEINEHAELQRYTNKNMRDLLKRQFGGDAFHREHSPGYHLFAVSSFQNVKRTGLFDDIKELSDTLARAKTHHQELRHPNGNLVALGDTDRGSPQSIARYAKRGLEPHAGGYSASGKLESGPLRVYRDDGYAIFREGWPDKPSLDDDYLFLGAGFHSSGHKHPDHLSFEWSFRGQPILVDSGKFTYTKGDWKRFFNSTRAGNSVEV